MILPAIRPYSQGFSGPCGPRALNSIVAGNADPQTQTKSPPESIGGRMRLDSRLHAGRPVKLRVYRSLRDWPRGYLDFFVRFLRFFLPMNRSRFLYSESILSSVTFLPNFLKALSRSPVTSTFAICSLFTLLSKSIVLDLGIKLYYQRSLEKSNTYLGTAL